MAVTCDFVRELLPWYLNGTLSPPEAEAVATHVDRCRPCRKELEETARVAWITDQHPSAELLADYALGLPLRDAERSTLERHLAHCDSCRRELSLAREAAGPPPRRAGRRDGPLGWSPVALAASLLVGVAIGVLWRSPHAVEPEPRGDVPLVELLPEATQRGDAGFAPAVVDRERSAFVLLLVALEDPSAADRWTARLVDAEGTETFSIDSAPDASGALTLLVPTSRLPAGESILVVAPYGAGPASASRYRLSVSGAPTSHPDTTKGAQ